MPVSRTFTRPDVAPPASAPEFFPEAGRTDPLRQDLRAVLLPPGGAHWLGTDHLGRSMLARLAHAARLSLSLGALTVLA
ncbi:MAG: hypothetical protein ACK524_11135, partial [Planctomyces sp.]